VDDEKFTGLRKAAILLLTIDEELSKEIIKDLEEEEIKALSREIQKIGVVSERNINRVHEEFLSTLNKVNNKTLIKGEDKFKSILKKTLGEEKAELLVDDRFKKQSPGDFLKRCDTKALSHFLRNEHPQTIALVLSVTGLKKAGEVLISLPEAKRVDVAMRMAYLEKVDKKILEDVENVLKEELESLGVVEGKNIGGVEMVANILNQLDKKYENEILEGLDGINPELAEKIKQLMFTFDDLIKLDDRSIQTLLKEISSDDLALALKGASDPLKEKIFSNMSERAAAMLKEDLESKGPVKVSDVEKAQLRIAMTAKKLDEEGKIIVARENEQIL